MGLRLVDWFVEGVGVGDGLVMFFVCFLRRSSSFFSVGRKLLIVVAREFGETDVVKETGIKEIKRERRLIRRIFLELKKVVSVFFSS